MIGKLGILFSNVLVQQKFVWKWWELWIILAATAVKRVFLRHYSRRPINTTCLWNCQNYTSKKGYFPNLTSEKGLSEYCLSCQISLTSWDRAQQDRIDNLPPQFGQNCIHRHLWQFDIQANYPITTLVHFRSGLSAARQLKTDRWSISPWTGSVELHSP